MGECHTKIGVPVRVDRQLRDVNFLLSKHSLDSGADLSLVEYDGLRIENPPPISHMSVNADGGCLTTWIEACLPHPLPGLQAHHVGGGQIGATPGRGDRMPMHVSQDRGTGLGKAALVTGPAHC